jgi:hypothetical protein
LPPGAIEEIQQKNIIFPEFLRSIRQISMGQRLFAYFLVDQKVGPRRHISMGLIFCPAKPERRRQKQHQDLTPGPSPISV